MRGTVAVIGIVVMIVAVSHMNRERAFAEAEEDQVAAADQRALVGADCHVDRDDEEVRYVVLDDDANVIESTEP